MQRDRGGGDGAGSAAVATAGYSVAINEMCGAYLPSMPMPSAILCWSPTSPSPFGYNRRFFFFLSRISKLEGLQRLNLLFHKQGH